MRGKKTLLRILIGGLIALVVLSWARNVAREIDEWRIAQQVKHWEQLAMADASTVNSIEDAKSWLRDHDFEYLQSGQGHVSAKNLEKDYFFVWGTRPASRWEFVSKPTWIEVKFQFSLDGRFEEVKASEWRIDPSF